MLLTLPLLGGVGGGLLSSCSQEDTTGNMQGAVRFNIYDAGNMRADATRATTDGSSMLTTFELGDKAGVYAVKGETLVLDNVQLTYNASGFWEPVTAIEATTVEGATFYAYYPYSRTATFDVSSPTPLDAMVAAVEVPTKQNTKAAYEAADVMITTGCNIGSYNAVSLPLVHQKAMVCVELPNSSYIFTNTGMEAYVQAKAENVRFTLGETTVNPYFDNNTQSYRLILQPGETNDLKVEFDNLGTARSYTAQSLSQIASGEYAKFVIDGGANLTTMTLQEGDYYCSDGTLISRDATDADLSKVIGVIVKTGTTDAITSANSSCTHGIVVSLSEVKNKWGEDGSTTTEQNNAGWRYWYQNYGLQVQNNTAAEKLDESLMAEEGYEVTRNWLTVPEPLTIGGITLDYTSYMNTVYADFVGENPLPANITSGWYFPSLKDWQNIDGVKDDLNERIIAADGKELGTAQYWSCNIRGAGSNWCYVLSKTSLKDRYKGVTCKTSTNYRFLFAF